MRSPIGPRHRRSAAALALVATLLVPAAVSPVAAAGPASPACDDTAAPNIWVLPLTSTQLYFSYGESIAFRVYIRNNWTCSSLPWRATNVVTSRSGRVWGYVPGGPTSGSVAPGAMGTTSFIVTAPPFYSPSADIYVAVRTPVSGPGSPGFHWSARMSD